MTLKCIEMKEGIANDLNPTGFSYKDKGRLYSNQN
jgi:hypothetical protein